MKYPGKILVVMFILIYTTSVLTACLKNPTEGISGTASSETQISASESAPVSSQSSPDSLISSNSVSENNSASISKSVSTSGSAVLTPEPTKAVSTEMLKIALAAQKDMYKNFWTGDSTTGHIVKENQGYPTTGKQIMIWAHAMMIFGMETMYEITGDADTKNKIIAQWNFTKDTFNEEQLITPGRAPNIAVDDSGWDAMAYMLFYRFTNDSYALQCAGKLIKNTFEFYKDGETSNGLWYLRNNDPVVDRKWKSVYSTGLLMAALDYYDVTKDKAVYNDALAAYNWIEKNMLRDGKKVYGPIVIDCSDHLYWADFNVNRDDRTEKNGPDGGSRPNDIKEAGSVSFLGGNMAMAVLHARFYGITGDEKYKVRALETVRAIHDGPYNNKGVYLDDRDAWSTATFTRQWVKYVLTLPGITEADKAMLTNTGKSVYTKARTDDGYYGGSWSGPADGLLSRWYAVGSKPQQIMTSGNSVNLIYGAALLEKINNGDGN